MRVGFPGIKSNSIAQRKCYRIRSERLKKQDLRKYYSSWIIFKQYRNLICVAMFDQYLISRRCFALEGYEECYNLYEQERLAKVIITELGDIKCQLKVTNIKAIRICERSDRHTVRILPPKRRDAYRLPTSRVTHPDKKITLLKFSYGCPKQRILEKLKKSWNEPISAPFQTA